MNEITREIYLTLKNSSFAHKALASAVQKEVSLESFRLLAEYHLGSNRALNRLAQPEPTMYQLLNWMIDQVNWEEIHNRYESLHGTKK